MTTTPIQNVYFTVGKGTFGDEKTQQAIVGFFLIWNFEKNLADFTSPKINMDLVHQLKAKKITIADFVRDSLQNEITEQIFVPAGNAFAKSYFLGTYLEEFKQLFGETCEASWENYAKIKVKIDAAYANIVTPKDNKPMVPADPNSRVGQLPKRTDHIFVIPAHPDTKFDEEQFLVLLEGSISLTMEEKKRVIDAIPRLSMDQINELIKIFVEEKQKFSELESEFSDDVAKLKKEREKEIEVTETKKEEESESEGDDEEAAKIKKEMGL